MELEKLEHSRCKAIFDVTALEFEKAVDEAFVKTNAKVTIKGFRAGKAPRSVFEKNYGVESLFEEALNIVLNKKAKDLYASEIGQEVLGQLEPALVGDEMLELGKDFKVSFTFDVYPEVNLPQYKGLECKKANLEITDEDVEDAIKQLMQKDSTLTLKAEQVIAAGDTANFDFVGSVDGVEFPGGKAENYELEIGSNAFIPGFEDQMIGMKAGEVKDVVVTFPDNYGEKSLAGKEAVFKVTVHEVKERTFPTLDDEYVKSLNISGVETVEALKASKREELLKKRETSEKDRQVDELINKILDNAVVDMPKTLEKDRIDYLRKQYESQAKMYNMTLETFIPLTGNTMEQFEEQITAQGKRQALFNVIFTRLLEEEKIAPSEEEIKAYALKYANDKMPVDVLLKNNYSRYYSDIAYNKLIDLLLANATFI